MILPFLCLIISFAQAQDAKVSEEQKGGAQILTVSAAAESIVTLPAPPKEVKTVTATIAASCNPTSTTTVPPKPVKQEMCVKCYKKIINTKDCKKCTTICDDGTRTDNVDTTKNACPNKKSEDVPCACKDQNGRVVADNYYKTNGSNIQASLVEDVSNIGN